MEFNVIKTVIAIYPGRFQPFGKHHAAAFKWLESKFGSADTFIATTDKVDPPKSPLNFQEKKAIISKYGFGNQVVQVKNPYQSAEITSKYDPKTTAVVFMVGEKDMKEDPRFTVGTNKSGKESYFRKYDDGSDLKPYTQHGYLIVAPHKSYDIPGVGEMSGTNIRKALSTPTTIDQYKKNFEGIFGWWDEKLGKLMKQKFSTQPLKETYILSSIFKNLLKESDISEKFDLKDRTWKDYNLSSLDADDMKVIWDMYSNTYAKNGLDFSASDYNELQNKYKAVYLEDIDNDGIPDAFIIFKPTEYGNKIALLGTNDKKEAKKELLKQVFKLLKTNGWFLEASMKMEDILSKSDVPVITNPKIIDSIVGHKGLELMDNGYYKRKLSKVDKTIIKRLYGKPKISSLNESLLRLLLKEGGAGGHMAHPFDLDRVKTGKDLLSVFEQTAKFLTKNPAPVKIDGVNASIRLGNIDGKREFVIDRGSSKELDIKGVTKADLPARFDIPGHGMIKVGGKVLDIFNKSLPLIKDELAKLGLIKNPNIMLNIEYVEGKTNVQDYGKNFLAIHGLLEITQNPGKKSRSTHEIPYSKDVLESMIKKMQPVAKKYGFEILSSIPAKLEKTPNYGAALSKNYTVNIDGKNKETKSLKQWLNEVNNTKGLKLKLKDGKTVDALSKQVFLAIKKGTPVTDLVENAKDQKIAIDSFVIYEATMELGDSLLKSMNSPLGPVDQQEGIVVRDKAIANEPFKITGSFIVRGLETSFTR